MNTPCQRIRRWLDDEAPAPLAPELESHAAACKECRPAVALERAMREGLPDVPGLAEERRAALVKSVLAAPAAVSASAGRRRSVPRWSWAVVAAAAAIAMAVALAWPEAPRRPILPSEILGDILGPLAALAPAVDELAGVPAGSAGADAGGAPVAPPTAAEAWPADAISADDVFGVFRPGLDGPFALARMAAEAPRLAAGMPPAAAAQQNQE